MSTTPTGEAAPPPPALDPVPFGKYQLLDRIAVGGMAEIFLARQAEGPDKRLVIKRIRSHLSRQTAFVKMLLNEAKLAAQLNHRNVVQIYDLGKIGETYFIAMEHIFGRDMRRVIPKSDSLGIPFPMVYALKIASSVCEGLYHAHQKHDLYGNPLNIVHRDVTPENVMVSFDGAVKILDFGIAKAQPQIEQSRPGEIKGKLSYMSPEQCQGLPLDQRSDLFSLGAVLYEWITGYKLFTGDSEVAILKSITEGKIYSPSYFKADIPDAVEAILMRALEKDRARRYQTAWDMQSDIDRFLADLDFTPQSVHLANFLRQVFRDELDESQAQLLLPPQEPEAPGASDVPGGPAKLGEPFSADPTAPLPTQPDARRQKAEAKPPPPVPEDVLDVPDVPPELPPEPNSREITARTNMPLPPGSQPDDRLIGVALSRPEAEQLELLARRNGLSATALASEILSMWLKYR